MKLFLLLSFFLPVFAFADACFERDVRPGTPCQGGSIFAGKMNRVRYMTTPGNCNSYLDPICDGKEDSLEFTWGETKILTNLKDKNNGVENTKKLATLYSPAARFCQDMVFGGYDDWFLPAENEMILMIKNQKLIGSFSEEPYWTSTEYTWPADPRFETLYGVAIQPQYGEEYGGAGFSKDKRFNVRCMRIATPEVSPNLPPKFSQTNTHSLSYKEQATYLPRLEKFIVLEFLNEKEITLKAFDRELTPMANVVLVRKNSSYTIAGTEILPSSTNPNVVVFVLKEKDSDMTAFVVDLDQEKILSSFHLEGYRNRTKFSVFRDFLLKRNYQDGVVTFEAYSFTGELKGRFAINDNNNKADFVFAEEKTILNVIDYGYDKNTYYDFFTGVEKFKIQFPPSPSSYSYYHRYAHDSVQVVSGDEDLKVYGQLTGEVLHVYPKQKGWEELFNSYLVRVNEHQEGFGIKVLDLVSGEEVFNQSCKTLVECRIQAIQTDPEDGRMKLIVSRSWSSIDVIDLETGKLNYRYESLVTKDLRTIHYLGYGRFKDSYLASGHNHISVDFVFNQKTKSVEFIRHGIEAFQIRNFFFLSGTTFGVIERKQISLYNR